MAAAVASTAPPRLGRAHRAPSPGAGSAAKAHKLGHVRRGAATARLSPPRALPSNADALLLDDGVSLADVDCIVMDCDGVIWQGDTLLPGARESIALLREQGKRLVFVTNNSNKSRKQYVYKFEQLGIAVEKEEIFSAAFAAAAYLKTRKFAKKAFVVGGRGIVDELNEMQIAVDPGVFDAVECAEADWEELFVEDDVGAVIVGQDTRFTYAKLAYASLAIQKGARFVATNPDAADFLGPGLMPGAGAVAAAVETATGKAPEIYAGKPSAFLLELLRGNGVDMARTLVVGDRLDTDVAFGRSGGAGLTVLTLGGVSSLYDVDAVIADKIEECIPDAIVEGLPQMLGIEARDEEEATEEEEEEEEEMDEDDEEAFDLEEDQAERDAFGAF